MTPNDTQIDVLLRRYAKHAKRGEAIEHLDADELSAFAERKLPSAAQARCVSHLADCDGCRKIAAQLAMTAGAIIQAERVKPEVAQEPGLWWQWLTSVFAPPMLRYAAFGIVLIALAGAIFLALRRPRESALVAQNEQPAPVSEVKAPETGVANNQSSKNQASRSAVSSEPAQNSNLAKKQDESKAARNPASPKTEKETASSGANRPVAGKKEEPAVAESSPSYAPPPPGERSEVTAREERDVRRTAEPPAPRTVSSSSDKSKAAEQARTDESAKDRRTENENRPVDQATTTQKKATARTRASTAEALGAATVSPNKRAVTESEKQATQNAGRAGAGASSETRSVGGHKFRRQGNAWVDAKFKPSMSVISISRGSDEFRALDSGVRSIAEQIGGEVLVVKSGKAYRIR